jgi:XTP/dITP diphosphohydrolase
LVLGTRNPGKVHEIKSILGDLPVAMRSLADFEKVGVAPEDVDTYSGNALSKVQYYARATGHVALADDSGLEVEALGGAPGVYSARYAGHDASDADRRRLLLSELANSETRRARFVCVVAISSPNGEAFELFEGVCNGTIGFEPRGSGGFGYDPIFIPEGYSETFAELPESLKNTISHRARALGRARVFLLSELGLT